MRLFPGWGFWAFFSALLGGALYLYRWDLQYNSDYAMIGLLAEEFLKTGHLPLFVPTVGYQGLLLEVPLVAAFIKIFDFAPWSLNLAPFALYGLFLWAFYQSVQLWHDRTTARWALFLLTFSTPRWYHLLLRTQPNYTEIFLLGAVLFWLYGRWVHRPEVASPVRSASPSQSPPCSWLPFLLGLVAGFGYYTYGQMLFFIGAMLGVGATTLGYAKLKSHLLQPATWILSLKKHSGKIDTALLGFALGYSPTWIHRWMHGAERVQNQQLGFHLAELKQRLGILLQGHWVDFWNLQAVQEQLGLVPAILSAVVLLGAPVFFIFYKFKWTIPPHTLSNSPHRLLLSPWLLFGATVTCGFIASRTVVDLGSDRYAIGLIPFYAVVFGGMVQAARAATQCPLLRTLAFLAITAWITTGSIGLYRDLRFPSPTLATFNSDPALLQPLAERLQQEGITAAYADFWDAYALTWIAQSRVVVEPIYTPYLDFISEKVRTSPTVAVIFNERRYNRFPFSSQDLEQAKNKQGIFHWKDRDFRIEKSFESEPYRVFVLKTAIR